MSLKKVFNVMKNEGLVVPKLDKFLLGLSHADDEDRGHGWNSPSGVSDCPRSQCYKRLGHKKVEMISPRVRRIFDNGHHMHDRIQTYLEKMGMMKLAETPVWSKRLHVLGSCDGMLELSQLTIGILELKSINDGGFKNLNGPKPEHVMQAQVYMIGLEELRQRLNKCKTEKEYKALKKQILDEYEALMDTFVVDGSKFTKEQKIAFKLETMSKTLDILWNCQKRIDTMVLIYENKNDQELKEFVVKWNDDVVAEIEGKYDYINSFVDKGKICPRPIEATTKTCGFCRNCDYSLPCWKG